MWCKCFRSSTERLGFFRRKAWGSVRVSLPSWRMLGLDRAEERGQGISSTGSCINGGGKEILTGAKWLNRPNQNVDDTLESI